IPIDTCQQPTHTHLYTLSLHDALPISSILPKPVFPIGRKVNGIWNIFSRELSGVDFHSEALSASRNADECCVSECNSHRGSTPTTTTNSLNASNRWTACSTSTTFSSGHRSRSST